MIARRNVSIWVTVTAAVDRVSGPPNITGGTEIPPKSRTNRVLPSRQIRGGGRRAVGPGRGARSKRRGPGVREEAPDARAGDGGPREAPRREGRERRRRVGE